MSFLLVSAVFPPRLSMREFPDQRSPEPCPSAGPAILCFRFQLFLVSMAQGKARAPPVEMFGSEAVTVAGSCAFSSCAWSSGDGRTGRRAESLSILESIWLQPACSVGLVKGKAQSASIQLRKALLVNSDRMIPPAARMDGGAKMTLAEWMRSRLSDAQRFLALCVLAGFLCGVTAVAFHFAIHHLFDWLWNFATRLKTPSVFCAVMIGAPTIAGLIVGLSVHYFAAGCGW